MSVVAVELNYLFENVISRLTSLQLIDCCNTIRELQANAQTADKRKKRKNAGAERSTDRD